MFFFVLYYFDDQLCIIVWSQVAYASTSVFLKIILSIQHQLCIHTNFKIICSTSVKNVIGILIENALNL